LKRDGEWQVSTWRDYRESVVRVALGFREVGVRRGDCVALMSRNRPEHLVCDLAALHLGAVPVSLYNTFSSDQISGVAAACKPKLAVVETQEQQSLWEKAHGGLKDIVVIVPGDSKRDNTPLAEVEDKGREALQSHKEWLEDEWKKLKPEDPATIIYTSGTTGAPKGVVITNYNALWTAESVDQWHTWPIGFKYVSYLPLAHSLERLAAHWLCTYKAAFVHFCPEVPEVFDMLGEVHPYAFVAVPRLWEKLESGIKASLQEQDPRKKAVAERAITVGARAAKLEQEGKRVPRSLAVQRALFDRVVLRKIRRKIGLDQAEVVLSGAAPLGPEVAEYFFGLGVKIAEGYGMSESTAPATINPTSHPRIGTVGPAIPGVELKLLGDGELLISGGNVSPGYLNDEAQTAEVFDNDGWLHSGDIAAIDSDGFVRIVDRKKELIVTAGGKNVSPSHLENLLKRHPLISYACVVGDRKPYIAALLALDADEVQGWADRKGIEFSSLEQLADEPGIGEEMQAAIEEVNSKVSRPEGIKRFVVAKNEWEPGGDELTPTLKLKRRAILDKYAEEIAGLYS
jgi:long-chain acyl-CoA synthetase